MAIQRKWTSAKPNSDNSDEKIRMEMLTKLKIFNEKFGTDIPPNDSDIGTVTDYYHRALGIIEDATHENYSTLQAQLQEFVEDEEDPETEKQSCCSRFLEWILNLCSCLSRVED